MMVIFLVRAPFDSLSALCWLWLLEAQEMFFKSHTDIFEN